ncbi:endoribonuclease L-PSP [Colletotrichum somersetense]|nr:endoribonuclease L-PSP [Colletotrichum somersetense]
MSHLRYYAYEGLGQRNLERFYQEINVQIDQAFANVDLNFKDAGGKGWERVYRVNSYHVPMNNEALGAMVRNFNKWMPNHKPIWSCVEVTRLAEDDMRVEIEVVALDPEGAVKV